MKQDLFFAIIFGMICLVCLFCALAYAGAQHHFITAVFAGVASAVTSVEYKRMRRLSQSKKQ